MANGMFLITCPACMLDLGRIEGALGERGKSVCPRCGWWGEWVFVHDDQYRVPILNLQTGPVLWKRAARSGF